MVSTTDDVGLTSIRTGFLNMDLDSWAMLLALLQRKNNVCFSLGSLGSNFLIS